MCRRPTAGNIRLEEGRPTDLWYSSCVDLLNSRFTPLSADYQALGISGITVTGVSRQVVTAILIQQHHSARFSTPVHLYRVHNRWLRNRFEKKLSQVADTSDATHKLSLEYLFMGEHPALPGELDRALEHGFRSPVALSAKVSGTVPRRDRGPDPREGPRP